MVYYSAAPRFCIWLFILRFSMLSESESGDMKFWFLFMDVFESGENVLNTPMLWYFDGESIILFLLKLSNGDLWIENLGTRPKFKFN